MGFIIGLLSDTEAPSAMPTQSVVIDDVRRLGINTECGGKGQLWWKTIRGRSRIAQIRAAPQERNAHVCFHRREDPKQTKRCPAELCYRLLLFSVGTSSGKKLRLAGTVGDLKAPGLRHIRGHHAFVLRDSDRRSLQSTRQRAGPKPGTKNKGYVAHLSFACTT